MFLVSACSCLCAIYWSQVLSGEWKCIWSSADRRCSNYIWVINNLIAYKRASYIRDLTVYWHCFSLSKWSLVHIALKNLQVVIMKTFGATSENKPGIMNHQDVPFSGFCPVTMINNMPSIHWVLGDCNGTSSLMENICYSMLFST